MRVLFFLNVLGGGGAEMHFVRMASALPALGIEPIFATLRGGGSYERMLPDTVAHHVLDVGNGGSTVVQLARSIRPLARLIDRLKPDLVCGVLALTALPAIVAARRSRHSPKIVLGIQNALETEVFTRRTPVALAQRALIPLLWPKADGIIALSHGVASDIARNVPSCANRITVIHNSGMPSETELAEVSRIEPERPEDRRVLVAVARLTAQKDYPTLIAAMKLLKTHPMPDLWILGSGEEEAALKALVDRSGLGDRVHFLGFRSDVLAYMRAADLFVLSSRWEGFANVIVEAMSMGTAVVSTACPHGPSEIITDHVNGRLVPVRDPAALAGVIDEMLGNEDNLRRIAAAGRERAEDFSVQAIAARYADAFRAIVREPSIGEVAG
ncbi:glycosyltransferase [Pseudopontixanthobacter vadosimaris]|uniref:glycosyltransferase n=1 Tax=Pseudopontixanthobacter vadosimaris TaxID=2726450 RepID=UPI0014762C3B|nr:glycosyltransferase [Pseudopontixanthobacter vadosimaris]